MPRAGGRRAPEREAYASDVIGKIGDRVWRRARCGAISGGRRHRSRGPWLWTRGRRAWLGALCVGAAEGAVTLDTEASADGGGDSGFDEARGAASPVGDVAPKDALPVGGALDDGALPSMTAAPYSPTTASTAATPCATLRCLREAPKGGAPDETGTVVCPKTGNDPVAFARIVDAIPVSSREASSARRRLVDGRPARLSSSSSSCARPGGSLNRFAQARWRDSRIATALGQRSDLSKASARSTTSPRAAGTSGATVIRPAAGAVAARITICWTFGPSWTVRPDSSVNIVAPMAQMSDCSSTCASSPPACSWVT